MGVYVASSMNPKLTYCDHLESFGSGCRQSGNGGTRYLKKMAALGGHFPFSSKGHMAYWLMKSEPGEVSIDDALAAKDSTVPWTGVRNYQARNFMRDQMQIGDAVLFYHSSCPAPGIAGLAQVVSQPYPDPTQFDPHSHYYDPKASPEQPRWIMVDVRAIKKTPLLSLASLRAHPGLTDMLLLQRGSRLSITPVTPAEWRMILALLP